MARAELTVRDRGDDPARKNLNQQSDPLTRCLARRTAGHTNRLLATETNARPRSKVARQASHASSFCPSDARVLLPDEGEGHRNGYHASLDKFDPSKITDEK